MQVKVKDSSYCVHAMPLDKDTLGLCNGYEKCIIIAPNQGKKSHTETLFHEILHAIEFEYNITIGHRIINCLEKSIPNILKNNPHLVKILTKL